MKVADVLSDLVALRACHPSDALSLVTVQPEVMDNGLKSHSKELDAGDKNASQQHDVQQAKDLVELHNTIKQHHIHQHNGIDDQLRQARIEVDSVLKKLDGYKRNKKY
ncbi:hypothetical protein FQN57_000998 [Myotisia sp. PD_48]|nr:hypothetical protein FQN57_000998 [Myotisia sp. PD_48]